MDKFKALRILNVILLISALTQATTALLAYFDLISDRWFKIFHLYNGPLLVLLIAFHLSLNFKWIAQNYFK